MDAKKIIVEGRFTRDPEIKEAKNGKTVASFTLAVQGMKKEDVEFYDCVAWDKTADFIEKYMKKGNHCLVIGTFKTEKWDGQDGSKHSKFKITAHEFFPHFSGKKTEGGASSDVSESEFIDDDIPF